MIINLVAAASLNNAIGKDNQLLWHLPNDMAFFKNITWGMPVIMGRKTYMSFGKPLKGRTNIVISHNTGLKIPGVKIAASLKEAVAFAGKEAVKQCFVIGGGEIYKQAMPLADRIYLTRVEAEMEGDAFFPPIDEMLWSKTAQTDFNADNQHAYAYSFEVWERKPS